MLTPEEQQIEICLLRSNLGKIENELVVQRTALPMLDVENEKKRRITLSALKGVRTMTGESERLRLQNIQLTAQRSQLKTQSDEIKERLETIRQYRDKCMDSKNQEQREIFLLVTKYEDSLQEKADLFRGSSRYYIAEEINADVEEEYKIIAELEDALSKKQRAVDRLRAKIDVIRPDIPEDILEQLGKKEIEEDMKSLTAKYEGLEEKRRNIKK